MSPLTFMMRIRKEVIEINTNVKQPMRNTVLQEIRHLRGNEDFVIDQRNGNRYQVLVKEILGHTAYCFSTPIYNSLTQKLVDRTFEKIQNGVFYRGSNGMVSICENRCVFENSTGRVVLLLKEKPMTEKDGCDAVGGVVVVPTLNGVRFNVCGERLTIHLKSEIKQEGIRYNPACFSVMKEAFCPFLSVATLYAKGENGVVEPVEMKYRELEGQTYELEFVNPLKKGTFVFEVNLYEPKLFQDTTVQSKYPDMNNAYGAIGFIGKTEAFGEQWLYLRPDFSKLSEVVSRRLEQVLLHMPVFNDCLETLDVFVPLKRFCSFGSTWNKKENTTGKVTNAVRQNSYLTIDVTEMFSHRMEKTLIYNEGLILRKPKDREPFVPIATGDCYMTPQILEIKLK